MVAYLSQGQVITDWRTGLISSPLLTLPYTFTCQFHSPPPPPPPMCHLCDTGPDEISSVMLKRCSMPICGRLACIFNASWSSGTVPSEWKVSRVTPIHKKRDTSLVKNYRPISLLSLVGKLQERLVHEVLLENLLKRNAISSRQFGFRPGSSTQESVTPSWHEILESGNSTLCVFVDLAN